MNQLKEEFNTARDNYDKEKEEPNRLAKANDNIASGVKNLKQDLEKLEMDRRHTSENQEKAEKNFDELSNALQAK